MPPRFAYWTILVGGLPTAFRAAAREEIEPTFRRLRDKHPDAELRWFARGKLWASPEEAREALDRHRARDTRPTNEQRDRNWRPGGVHRDPRQPYKDAKKRENQRKRERRFEFKKDLRPPASGFRPEDDRTKWNQRPHQPRPKSGDRRPETDRQERKPWERPGPKSWQERERRKAQGTGHKEERRPWQRSRPEPRPWERPGPKWRPTDDRRPKTDGWRPKTDGWRPKTDDRRPKTDAGRGPRPGPRGRFSGRGPGRGPKR